MTNREENKKPKIITEIAYKNEQVVNNGDVDKIHVSAVGVETSASLSIPITINGEEKTFNYKATFNGNENATVTLNKLRDVYSKTNSVDETYDYLKSQIMLNPDNMTNIITDLCGTINELYDSEQSHENIGDSAKDMLQNILACENNETIKGFVCMGIHEFGMKLLHDCHIPAVTLCGSSNGNNHATLLYQKPDGKFVYNNYGTSMTIDAPSLMDAVKTVYKQSGDLESAGYITLVDENNSYQRFAFEQEALWANELDKMDYNKTSPSSRTIISNKSEIAGRYEISNVGNMEATVTGNFAHGTSEKSRQTSVSLGYRKNGKTALFDNSNAVGVKFEHNGLNFSENGDATFFKTKAVVQNIQGERHLSYVEPFAIEISSTSNNFIDSYKQFLHNEGVVDTSEYLKNLPEFNSVLKMGGRSAQIKESNNVSAFLNGVLGKKINLVKQENLNLSNSGQVSLTGGATYCDGGIFGDARLTIEDGFGLTTSGSNWEMENSLSAGYVGDLKLTGGSQKGGIQSGVKLNAGTTFMANPNKKTFLVINAEAHSVALKPYQEYGLSSSLFGAYQLSPQKDIYGQISYSKDIQNIDIGGFSGKSKDKSVFGVTMGTQLNKANVYVSYNKSMNGINKTYNNSTVTVGAKISF